MMKATATWNKLLPYPEKQAGNAGQAIRLVPQSWQERREKTVMALLEAKSGLFWLEGKPLRIRLAGELRLHVIVRPSPYICAEPDLGPICWQREG
jgi:hypothetical protein